MARRSTCSQMEITMDERRNTLPENILNVDEVRMNLARNLVAARTALETSQDTLATRASVSRATVIQIEGGEGDPRLSTLASLADALGVSPMFLLLGREDVEALSHLRNSKSLSAVPDELSEEEIGTMGRLLSSGISRNRNKAIKMGTAAAAASGMSAAILAGAAIGSVLMPGIGTIIGSVLGGFRDLKRKDHG